MPSPKNLSRQELLEENRRLRERLRRFEELDPKAPPKAGDPLPAFVRRVLDSIPAQVAIFDGELRYLYVNPASISNPELRRWIRGRTDFEYCEYRGRNPQIAQRREEGRRQALRERRTITNEEDLPGPDGEVRRFLRVHSPVLSEDGASDLIIGYGVDITEQRDLEVQLQQVQKLEAVGQLAGGLAHDFNNLLTTILGYAQMLREQLPEGDMQWRFAGEIVTAGQRAARLVGQLLAFSRKQVLQPRVFDLTHTVQDTLNLLRSTLGDNIRLEVDIPQGTHPLTIQADPIQIEQVLLNLAVNARDAMPRGGSFLLSLATVPAGTEVEGHPLTTPHRRIIATDTGCGMDEEVRRQVFEPFFTTKGPGKGTGLGLSTVYGIVEQSGGHITVLSRPGSGTTFEIYLPAAGLPAPSEGKERAPGEGEETEPQTQATEATETVLVAEDETGVRLLTCEMLRRLGYHVLEAVDGQHALEVIEQDGDSIDLLLTDVVMPRLGGLELAQQLHRQKPELRVLFMSGYARGAARRELADVPFLAKPFRPEDLGAKVRAVLDGESTAHDLESTMAPVKGR